MTWLERFSWRVRELNREVMCDLGIPAPFPAVGRGINGGLRLFYRALIIVGRWDGTPDFGRFWLARRMWVLVAALAKTSLITCRSRDTRVSTSSTPDELLCEEEYIA
jgi:hypothetical protein